MENNDFKKCILCQKNMRFYINGNDMLYKTTDRTFEIYKCCNCGLEMIYPTPNKNEISSFYPKNYYSYNINDEGFFQKIRIRIINIWYGNTIKKDIFYFFALLLNNFLEGLPRELVGNNNFLDIGCGNGNNLKILSKFGWNCYGFEFSDIEKREENIFYAESFCNIKIDDIKFDYIRLWHVLEHIPNPVDVIKKISELMSEKSELAIGIPNTNSIYAKLFGKYWYNRDIPRHLINYNIDNLKILLDGAGLRIESVKHSSLGGFIGSLQHYINYSFHKNTNLINNKFFLILFSPLDFLCNLLKMSDVVSIKVVKNNTK